MQRRSLDLALLKFSTGEYHPSARDPLIHVQRSPTSQPYVSVRIVGNNLALVVNGQGGSKLFIFDWKTGHKRLVSNPLNLPFLVIVLTNSSTTNQLSSPHTIAQFPSLSLQSYSLSPTASYPTSKSGTSSLPILTLNLPSKSSPSKSLPSQTITPSSVYIVMEKSVRFSTPCHTSHHGLSSSPRRLPSSPSTSISRVS